MNKHLLILAPVFLFAVFPAFASQDDNNNSNKDKDNKHESSAVRELNAERGGTSDSALEDDSDACDEDGEWKNHGAYVSCVSHQGRGGQSVSEAARSDIGKKHKLPKPSKTPSVTPSIVPSITPSIVPSEIPSITPSASPSVTLSPAPEDDGTVAVPTAQLQAFIVALEGIVNFLKNLL